MPRPEERKNYRRNKDKGVVQGQVHAAIAQLDGEGLDAWLEDEVDACLEGMSFLQKSSNPTVEDARRTLSPFKLYLDTCSSFN